MFCNQCEQTAQGKGCTVAGVCGKSADIQSLQETLLYGLKGIAAYAYHARELGKRDEQVDAFVHEALFKTLTNVDFDLDDFIALNLKAGEMNYRVMEMLDKANTERFGFPTPAKVETGTRKAPGILVSGHGYAELEELLRQTEGTGIQIYTHGEMLPAHGYPAFRKYKHLAGNWGTAWQNQRKEFPEFGGPVLITTNCVQIPTDEYRDRLYTTSIAKVAGVRHLADKKDYSEIIRKALEIGDLPERQGKHTLTTGFHHSFVLGVADKILKLVKEGKVRRIILVGGCDGAKPGRNYYTEFVEKAPKDTLILTLACGKYRFNHMDLGDIEGIPRLLDMGQCNDAYSAITVAAALSKATGLGLNELPLTLVLSWYEQKAVAILLTLLHLNVRGMRIGPTPPAFWTPTVAKVIMDKFDLRLIGTADEDLKLIMG